MKRKMYSDKEKTRKANKQIFKTIELYPAIAC